MNSFYNDDDPQGIIDMDTTLQGGVSVRDVIPIDYQIENISIEEEKDEVEYEKGTKGYKVEIDYKSKPNNYSFNGHYFGIDPDEDIIDLSPNQSYRGSMKIVKGKDKYYIEAFAETFPGGQNGNKIGANLRVIHNGEEVGFAYLSMKNEWGEHYFDSSWKQIGYARLYLPSTGTVQVKITLYSSKYRFFFGTTLHTLCQKYIEFP